MKATQQQTLPIEYVPINQLKPHPRNYRSHPEDQLAHIRVRIEKWGIYRPILIARDNTILGGHGVTASAESLGYVEVPCRRYDLDPDDPQALEILAGDNEVDHLSENDDRALSELLREIRENDPLALLGTGYDEMTLANLVMVTRPSSEIQDIDEAAHWIGLPEYTDRKEPKHSQLVVHFATEKDRKEFEDKLGIKLRGKAPSTWYPPRTDKDVRSLKFQQ